jgi:hypothetical protein
LLWVVGLSLPDSRPTSSELGVASATPHTRQSFASLRKTRASQARHAEHCAARLTAFSPKQENRIRAPLMGLFKDPPSVDIPLCIPSTHRSGARGANLERGSVLVVLPDFNGLLHTELCGLVASRCRPWGSLGFEPVVDHRSSQYRQTFLTNAYPSELFPPLRPNPVTPTLLPGSPKPVPLSLLLSRQARKPVAQGDLRGLTITESVAVHRCCHQWLARCSHGLLRPRALARAPEVAPCALHTTEVTCRPRCKHRP